MFETKVDGVKLSASVPEPNLPSRPSVRGSRLLSTLECNGFPRHSINLCLYTFLLAQEPSDMSHRATPIYYGERVVKNVEAGSHLQANVAKPLSV